MSRIEDIEASMAQLALHRENLQACATFEEFKVCQVAFVAMLIEDHKAQLLDQQRKQMISMAMEVFMHDTDIVAWIKNEAEKVVTRGVWQHAPSDADPARCPLTIPERGHCPICDEVYQDHGISAGLTPEDAPDALVTP